MHHRLRNYTLNETGQNAKTICISHFANRQACSRNVKSAFVTESILSFHIIANITSGEEEARDCVCVGVCVARIIEYTRAVDSLRHRRASAGGSADTYADMYIESWKQVDRLTFGRASFSPAPDEYFRCPASPVSPRDATRRGRKSERERATVAAAAAAAASVAAWLLLCIGESCPGELSTRNDPREAKKMQTTSHPWISNFSISFLPSFSLSLRFPAAMMSLISEYRSIAYEYQRITYLFARVPIRPHRPFEGR